MHAGRDLGWFQRMGTLEGVGFWASEGIGLRIQKHLGFEHSQGWGLSFGGLDVKASEAGIGFEGLGLEVCWPLDCFLHVFAVVVAIVDVVVVLAAVVVVVVVPAAAAVAAVAAVAAAAAAAAAMAPVAAIALVLPSVRVAEAVSVA